jgi:environmental stress-induced protein Ves
MRKLDAASYRAMPWKNGGGTTTEIARAGAGEAGSLDDFDWRISMARVAAAGPFSRFAGVDRSLAIVAGDGMTLAIEGRGAVTLDRRSPPLAFPADVPVAATLAGGPVDDFNVMTRRARWRHLLSRVVYDAPASFACLGDRALLFVVEGSAVAERAGASERLAARDALLLERGAPVTLAPGPRVELLAVDLWSY